MKNKELKKIIGLKEFIEDKMKVWNVPGLAIGIVKEGQIIFCESLGKRDIEKGLEVTSNTLFPIGSATKAFTSMCLSMLVDEGKLSWDRPIRDYINEFKMYDLFTSQYITARDMACHRSGLPRHDFMWYDTQFSRKEIVRRIQYLQPSMEFRTSWQYQNIMYIVLGYLIEKISDLTWEEFVKSRIFGELNMINSNFSVVKLQTSNDYSYPYKIKDGRIIKMSFKNISEGGPAGSINSNLNDMLNWLMVHLNEGKLGDRQLVSKSNFKEMCSPQIIASTGTGFKEFLYSAYGLGWFIDVFRGHSMIHHDGNIDGFTSLVSFMPQENLGMVILTNMNNTLLHKIICFNVYERLLELNQTDWSNRLLNRKSKNQIRYCSKDKNISINKNATNPLHELKDYIGKYKHLGYGILNVRLDGKKLKVILNCLEIPLTHYEFDIFEMNLETYDTKLKITFYSDAKGNVFKASIPFESRTGVDEIMFIKIAD